MKVSSVISYLNMAVNTLNEVLWAWGLLIAVTGVPNEHIYKYIFQV